MRERPSTSVRMNAREISARWPHISRFLELKASGEVDHEFLWWESANDRLRPMDRAAGYEEWAGFFEWRLEQRADELAGDRIRRHLAEKWTDSMTYCCRRSATRARGTDPGEWIPQHVRRPDLDAEGRAIADKIIAEMDACSEPAEQAAVAG